MDVNENKDWQKWHEQYPHEPAGLMKQIWEGSRDYKNDYQPDVSKGFEAFKMRMNEQSGPKVVRLTPISIALRIAAGAALLLVATMVLRNFVGAAENLTAVNTVADETKEIMLADASKVTLNQNSSLNYETEFNSKKRQVSMQGEAFFKVSRDEKRPFTIETQTAFVQVLGTSFNVRSYPNEDFFEVFVETGKVKVTLKNSNKSYELTPGQFIRFKKSENKIEQGIDQTAAANAWRTGAISFKGQQITTVLKGMERLYGVKMEIKSQQRNNCKQTLTMQKDKLDEAMEALKISCPKLNFERKSDTGYIVTGICCE